MSAEIIDVRYDRFLRELREHGTWKLASQKSGLSEDEVSAACAENPKFDLSQVECLLEYHEEFMLNSTEKSIAAATADFNRQMDAARDEMSAKIAEMKEVAHEKYRIRHGGA